ncbi:MAG: S1 RNA-binding domain-containing protein [Candidatus Berkelbacteria bacterium]|nr:S1 RNA-binding domain-containing protein [Candidatus Berkelbacteria bacterium]
MKQEEMKDFVKSIPALIPFKAGEVVEVEVLNKNRSVVLVDILGLTEGIIPFKEWGEEGISIKPGDKTIAYVMLMENDRGRMVLSLRRADQQRVNISMNQKYQDKETMTVRCVEANKGGVLCELGATKGFLPVSQLSSAHYPRVAGDRDKILAKLQEIIGESLKVKIIGFDNKTNSPIFSEKSAQVDRAADIKVGEVLEGIVSGVTDFGIFVNLGEFDGLVHISEASWSHISDLSKLVKVGEKVKVKVIEVENGRVFLSLKRLSEDPFVEVIKKYKEGDVVEGKVTRIVPFGAFVQLGNIEGLAKLMDLSDKRIIDPKEVVEEGKEYKFKVIRIDKEGRKINLSLKEVEVKKPKTKPKTKARK